MFTYDVFSLIAFIMLGVIFKHLGKIKGYNYKHIAVIAFFIAIVSVSIVYCIMFTGLGSFLSKGILLHIFGVLFIAIPIVFGEYRLC